MLVQWCVSISAQFCSRRFGKSARTPIILVLKPGETLKINETLIEKRTHGNATSRFETCCSQAIENRVNGNIDLQYKVHTECKDKHFMTFLTLFFFM